MTKEEKLRKRSERQAKGMTPTQAKVQAKFDKTDSRSRDHLHSTRQLVKYSLVL